MAARGYKDPGCFITLEGGEGAGKSTQLETVTQFLKQHDMAFITTREPGGTVVSEAIRGVLLDTKLPAMHADTELLLVFAARNEHLQQVIIPALQQGKWVICDRFTDASYAYQGYGRELPLSRIATLETWVQGTLRPDFTLLFDIDVHLSHQRVKQRSSVQTQHIDRFEREEMDFHQRIRNGYLQRAVDYPQQFIKIDGSNTLQQVEQDVLHAMQNIIAKKMS